VVFFFFFTSEAWQAQFVKPGLVRLRRLAMRLFIHHHILHRSFVLVAGIFVTLELG
jgi:hypothetical protein